MAENKTSSKKQAYRFNMDLEPIIMTLSDKQAGQLIIAVLEYMNGITPIFKSRVIKIAFMPFKRAIDQQNYNTGYKHHNWKGGITPINKAIRSSSRIQNWRKSVFHRDRFTCQTCFQKGGVLHAHHIKSFAAYPELRFELSNGITLCKTCHTNIHRKNGK